MSSFKPGPGALNVRNFVPQEVHASQTAQAGTFVRQNTVDVKESFELNKETAHHIGLSDAKTKERQKQFDHEVFKYVQKIKDGAHTEAYEEGLRQGIAAAKEEALKAAEGEIQAKVSNVVEVINGINKYRSEMFTANEEEIIDFCYMLAEKIVERELQRDPELILHVIKKITVGKENVVVKVSQADFDFIQSKQDLLAIDAKISFESDPKLSAGDVIVQGEQGAVDGSLQTRLEKLKKLLHEE